tara:strand:+ start:160 stop:1026 length:867 start_codon:yes stop_codon:yes gene_type:complete
MDFKTFHQPVLVPHLLSNFNLNNNAIVVDATLGFAGHATAILNAYPNVHYIGFDKDPMAIDVSKQRCQGFPNVDIIQATFSSIPTALNERCITPTHVLFDLGVSSYQIDQSDRGFTFQRDEPLDMRMNPNQTTLAKDILNNQSKEALLKMFKEEGDIRFPEKLVDIILTQRDTQPFSTTMDLVSCIKRGFFVKSRPQFIAICTKVFQAIRVTVNNEMGELRTTLAAMLAYRGATIAVISFQPNEDRCVKQFVKANQLTKITKKPLQSTYAECKKNPREKSAKLRIFQV